jgi:hypothetical protein
VFVRVRGNSHQLPEQDDLITQLGILEGYSVAGDDLAYLRRLVRERPPSAARVLRPCTLDAPPMTTGRP